MPDQSITDDYLHELVSHKKLVGHYLNQALYKLIRRAIEHDMSKFGPEEFWPYAYQLPRFREVEYGTPDYQECIKAIRPAIDHHFQQNRHHPEHFPEGIGGMNLLDVLEMVCDWMAASQRGGGGPLRLDLQQKRFGIDDQLQGLIERTVIELT